MELSTYLRDRAGGRWRAATDHPFVDGIRTGTLAREAFAFYLAQDYVFLVGYCRVFGLATAKAPDLQSMRFFAELLGATVGTEMDLHRELSAGWGVSVRDLEATAPAPTTQGYVDHLLATAALGEIDRIVASLLPCQVGYAEIGQALSAEGADTADNPYAPWIRTYADPEFQRLAAATAALLDRLGADAPPARRDDLFATFQTSCRYERAFWDMAWHRHGWSDAASEG